ncbi:MAG: hypothetical protein MUO33_08175 [Sedimentisphaerales bacterium]|jgi:hypothetical protein|nr:hypothetical protein [Sedimentisphaerales bacterium]
MPDAPGNDTGVENQESSVKSMAKEQKEKPPKAVSKSFMTVGPTLHYSHKNVQRCWLLAVIVFGLCCFFWSRIVTGLFWSFDLQADPNWRLDRFIMTGASIFEYPWQILVFGLLMGIMAAVPVLISQLLSFHYSLIFILEVFFLANLPGFAVCLLVSCFAAACRPFRFRSRFVAIALCMAPQLLYWGYFGGARGVEPTKWGFSFAPWICAWLVGLTITAEVLATGHFTRYRPGIVWIFTAATLLVAVLVFEAKIGLNELDYQFYVAENNPENVVEFRDYSITEALDKTITDPVVRRYLEGFFYPTEPIPLREELKKEIQIQLSYDRWPSWFAVSDQIKYQEKRQWLNQQYELFMSPRRPRWMPVFLYSEWIKKRSTSKRMLIALYCKALLGEYAPDINLLGQKEVLHFYTDYPHERSAEFWYRLYREFANTPESLEARWRIAVRWAGLSRFTEADELLAEAQKMAAQQLKLVEKEPGAGETLLRPFREPSDSVMTELKLIDLARRISQTRTLISPQNQTQDPAARKRLAEFVMLNPHSQDYSWRLSRILAQIGDADPLRDNILLAQTTLIADEQTRAEKLKELHEKFQATDGAMQALYELGLLKRRQWTQQDATNLELKKKLLAETRATLTSFISLYPGSIYAEQVQKTLAGLPTVE